MLSSNNLDYKGNKIKKKRVQFPIAFLDKHVTLDEDIVIPNWEK